MKVFIITFWFILCITLLEMCFNMISAPSTLKNVIGFLVIVAITYISIKTKCLTKINLKRKHEK